MLKNVKRRMALTSLLVALLLTLSPVSVLALPQYGAGTENNPYLISTCDELQDINEDLDAHYSLINNIWCTETSSWNGGDGFEPIGAQGSENSFSGVLDGNGFEIRGLYFDRDDYDETGLFEFVEGDAVIKNVGLVDAQIEGSGNTGGLVGALLEGTIQNSFVQGGSISADGIVAGLVGFNFGDAVVINSYSTAAISGGTSRGLVGVNAGTITNSFWDTTTSGQISGILGTGRNTATMKTESNFTDAGWDFDEIWDIDETEEENDGYPYLRDRVSISTAAPQQSHCNNGSTTYTWDGLGLDRPVVAGMFVDGEEVEDPANPEDGSIGVVICANTDNARKTGLTVVYRDGNNYSQDLTQAETPDGDPITADSDITITLTNMGELAEFYSFSLVHGVVSEWETANLGTPDASLSFTFSPAETPIVDYMAEGAQFCSATPPTCDVEKSAIDILSASLDMDYDQDGMFAEMTGAYFGLVNAVSGYVTNQDGTISATLGAPHFMADGVTERVGSMNAFLPESVVQNVWGVSSADITADNMVVNRLEDEEVVSDDPPFSVEQVDDGIIVLLTDITFSTPTYTFASSVNSSGGSNGGGSDGATLANTGVSQIALTLVAITLLSSGTVLMKKRLKALEQ